MTMGDHPVEGRSGGEANTEVSERVVGTIRDDPINEGREGSIEGDPVPREMEGREELETTGSDLASEDSDTDVASETPVIKRKLDPEFVLDTPQRRGLAEFPGLSNGLFVDQTSQFQGFIDQVNETSKCATPSCEGKLKPDSVKLVGLGGAVDIAYSCTGCLQRQLTFNSSIQHEASGQTAIGLALQVAFIAAGCNHAQYKKVLAHTFGMYAVSSTQFYSTLRMMYPHVTSMVDEQCDLAKEQMKAKPAAEIGSFENAVTTADGAWLTRGFHSQNFSYQVRDYLTGALLYYQHLCQKGGDNICEGGLFGGTSKAAEGLQPLSFLVEPRKKV